MNTDIVSVVQRPKRQRKQPGFSFESQHLKEQLNSDFAQKIGDKVQDGLEKVHIDSIGGWGVKATKPFKAGDFIIEYRGDRITRAEYTRRIVDYPESNEGALYPSYCLEVIDIRSLKNKYLYIDAHPEPPAHIGDWGLAKFFNHSKSNPNCHCKRGYIGTTVHCYIVAANDIKVGDELRWDYYDNASIAPGSRLSKEDKEAHEANPFLSE